MSKWRVGQRFSFSVPNYQYEIWVDKAVEELIDQVADFSMPLGPVGKVRIVSAKKYEDNVLGPGIWIEAELIEEKE